MTVTELQIFTIHEYRLAIAVEAHLISSQLSYLPPDSQQSAQSLISEAHLAVNGGRSAEIAHVSTITGVSRAQTEIVQLRVVVRAMCQELEKIRLLPRVSEVIVDESRQSVRRLRTLLVHDRTYHAYARFSGETVSDALDAAGVFESLTVEGWMDEAHATVAPLLVAERLAPV